MQRDEWSTKTDSTVAAKATVTTTSITLQLPDGCRKFRLKTPAGSEDLRVRIVEDSDPVVLDASDITVRADTFEEFDTYPTGRRYVAIQAATGTVTVFAEALDGSPGAAWDRFDTLSRQTLLARYYDAESSQWANRSGAAGGGVHSNDPVVSLRGGSSGMLYDGVDQLTTLGDVDDFEAFVLSNDGWVCGWIYVPDQTDSFHCLFGNTGTGGECGVALYVENRTAASATRQIRFLCTNGTGGIKAFYTANGTFPADTLVHLAARRISGSNSVQIFLNGVSQTIVNGATGIPIPTQPLVRAFAAGYLPQAVPALFGNHEVYDIAVCTSDLTSVLAAIVAEGPR